ncbi:polysaccharide deacetylase family protein [uncultured Dysosmobacter sp.]|uniref:polysaccharide deacetylase family protein n=1 Tax=uncultured Dysosmobacter sp. TaxID=2591384 RepID=UPI00261BD77D|nr:polysaccharide deacetylase family protein [uncultured Dysosmobacter sp.]
MRSFLSLLLVLSLATACGTGGSTQAVSASVQPPPTDTPEPPVEEAPVPVRIVDPSRPMVALTFDDGPHAQYTDQLLDILEEHNAVATFFEVAKNLPNDPDAVRRAAEMGCEIGSHSYRHANLGKMKLEALQADLAAADAAFIDVLGTAPTLLRPPYGSTNKALKTACDRAIVTWSIDPEDWKCRDAEKVIAHIQGFKDLDGQVILLHSTYESTVEAARVLVPWLEEQGYQLVTVSELITLRFQDTVDVNRLYNFDYFRFKVPPLAKPTGEPAA